MKLIRKSNHQLTGNKGETIVEVVVAFTVLSIMMLMFSQGITYASRTGVLASKTRDKADKAMIALQDKINSNNVPQKVPVPNPNGLKIYRQDFFVEVDGTTYTYIVYSTDTN